ncbi:MAG: GTPase HflX [Elusimicrobia bacterium]|jgi:GTP-binding protein HflX|nr:GTPase HflX [Elusimicrobiota bacterium]
MERAVVVGIRLKGGDERVESASLLELKRLLETAGGVAEATVVQERARRDPATLIGEGKAVEIAELVKRDGLSAVVFDEELSPSQQKNLQEVIPAKIIDRTRLILDIFAQRARTREGKLQVELAQMNYLLPRITERYGRFEQQTGGIGTRGPGERKLEISQRRIRERIVRLKREMVGVRHQRALQRDNRRRTPVPLVAIVGYTNAGKSTLLNALHTSPGLDVLADDKLFATLDPTTRRVKLPGGRPALFVDTVGFIQRLPHHLVAAFHATLEEARDSDFVVHVVDASNPDWVEQKRVVEDVLRLLEADKIPRMNLFNKCDALTSAQRAQGRREGRVMVSARKGDGLDRFLSRVEAQLEVGLVDRTFVLPHRRRDLLPVLYGTGRIVSEKPAADGTRFRVKLDDKNWGFIRKELEHGC